MNDLRLKSIFDLLNKNYFIPSYQRGYRWEKRQIEDLLDDLYAFAKSKKEVESFYCLQPVILKPCDEKTVQENNLTSSIDDNKWYARGDRFVQFHNFNPFHFLMRSAILFCQSGCLRGLWTAKTGRNPKDICNFSGIFPLPFRRSR